MKLHIIASVIAFGTLAASPTVSAEPPFGQAEDVAYAAKLWTALTSAHLVGPDRVMSAPYTGQHPHGAILDTMDSKVTVDGMTGPVLIKHNYGGTDVSRQAVWNDPDKFLQSVTVMYKREGFDPDNQDWFWVKYVPDGSLATNPKGVKLAGKVAKGMDQGCIACHTAAPGGDMVYGHDRIK